MKRDQHKVQVWNDHDFTWEEIFKGDKISIPPKGHISMNFYEAYEFRGQIVPLMKQADETISPKSQKKIRCVEADFEKACHDNDVEELQDNFTCNLCKEDFSSAASLVKHSEQKHADRIVTDPDAEEAAPKKRGRPPKAS